MYTLWKDTVGEALELLIGEDSGVEIATKEDPEFTLQMQM